MRKAETQKLDQQFIQRWSPRAFDNDKKIDSESIKSILEAAKWAPSCFNEQPWFFHIGIKGESHYDAVFDSLVEGNQGWAKNAPVLMIVYAKKQFDRNGDGNTWAQFDCGAAWMSIALQANILGIDAHAMAGFNPKKAIKAAKLNPEKYQAMAAIALGYRADADEAPNDRKELSSLFSGDLK